MAIPHAASGDRGAWLRGCEVYLSLLWSVMHSGVVQRGKCAW